MWVWVVPRSWVGLELYREEGLPLNSSGAPLDRSYLRWGTT